MLVTAEKSSLPDRVNGRTHSVLIEMIAMLGLPAFAISYLVMRGLAGFHLLEASMLVVGYFLTGFGITGGYHRLVTHRSYILTPKTRWIVIALGSMAVQSPVLDWATEHRRHHRYSDQARDPHSPVYGQRPGIVGAIRGLIYAQMGWVIAWYFDPSSELSDKNEYVPDLLTDPQLVQLNRLFPWLAASGVALPVAIGFLVRGTAIGALDGFFWAAVVRVVAGHQVTSLVNSVCHLFGTRPYRTKDNSRNNFFVALLTLGEGWHNNHHAFPSSPYHGLRWWQPDLTGWIISMLRTIGLASGLKVPRR